MRIWAVRNIKSHGLAAATATAPPDLCATARKFRPRTSWNGETQSKNQEKEGANRVLVVKVSRNGEKLGNHGNLYNLYCILYVYHGPPT